MLALFVRHRLLARSTNRNAVPLQPTGGGGDQQSASLGNLRPRAAPMRLRRGWLRRRGQRPGPGIIVGRSAATCPRAGSAGPPTGLLEERGKELIACDSRTERRDAGTCHGAHQLRGDCRRAVESELFGRSGAAHRRPGVPRRSFSSSPIAPGLLSRRDRRAPWQVKLLAPVQERQSSGLVVRSPQPSTASRRRMALEQWISAARFGERYLWARGFQRSSCRPSARKTRYCLLVSVRQTSSRSRSADAHRWHRGKNMEALRGCPVAGEHPRAARTSFARWSYI